MVKTEGTIVRPGVYMRYENIGPVTFIVEARPGGSSEPGGTGGSVETPKTLEEAIAEVENGGTVVLSADTTITSPLKILEGKSLTISVPAGVTLDLDAGSNNYGMVIKGDVTIEGEGDIVLTGYGIGTSMNTDSKLTIKSGHFIAKGCDYIIGCFDGEVVIEGGTFEGEYCVVNNFSDYYKKDGKVIITGGTFTSQEEGFDILGGPVEISGGTFSKPVSAEHCAEGMSPVENEDGTYTVA